MRSAHTHQHRARASPHRPTSSALELSIHGDEVEQDRIQLEHNLQQTDLSLHLSSAAENSDAESIEYPRHNSGPSSMAAAFRSFDDEGPSQMHGWSYRTADDDEGVHPYGGGSLSTAAHHASALTLTAGLAGRGARRDVSISGAEYDPERPIHEMIAGIGNRLNAKDDPLRVKYPNAHAVGFDPLVVDSTIELDRYLRSGRATPLRSPQTSSSPSTPKSGRASPAVSRPKLSDQLERGSFSPKRPRGGVSSPVSRGARPNTPTQLRELAHASRTPARPSPLPATGRPVSPTPSPRATRSRSRTEEDEEVPVDSAPTPRPRAKVRGHASAQSQPNIQLQPPTPSLNSTFARRAKDLGREIAAEKERANQRQGTSLKPTKMQPERSALRGGPTTNAHRSVSFDVRADIVGLGVVSDMESKQQSKVHLPDVTGLTSAVGSPARVAREYRKYREAEGAREAEARLLGALNAVQAKLLDIEAENSISRRRVRELEKELEECKQDVARERTRVMEKEEMLIQQRKKITREAQEDSERRYKQVVEEKKALEALIATLRTHLTRLTAELTSHKELLEEFKSLREADERALKEKCAEVDRLREEVERLSGEVEVLRDVVEEGLKERRAAREELSRISEHSEEVIVKPEEEDPSLQGLRSRSLSPPRDRSPQMGRARPQFVDDEELEQISIELAERRSERSLSGVARSSSAGSSRAASPVHNANDTILTSSHLDDPTPVLLRPPSPTHRPRPSSRQNLMHEDFARRPSSRQAHPSDNHRPASRQAGGADHHDLLTLPTAPAPGHAHHISPTSSPKATAPQSPPFPTIRGPHLERLFFSAPDHNEATCRACNRGGHTGAAPTSTDKPTPSWLRDLDSQVKQRGPRRAAHGATTEDEKLPPQTVLARVLRELEDDFAHYKSIYVELAEQYAVMDAASNVARRNVLAGHLREVIDCLEQKGDQIASLYDLLTFKDKPVSESVVPEKRAS